MFVNVFRNYNWNLKFKKKLSKIFAMGTCKGRKTYLLYLLAAKLYFYHMENARWQFVWKSHYFYLKSINSHSRLTSTFQIWKMPNNWNAFLTKIIFRCFGNFKRYKLQGCVFLKFQFAIFMNIVMSFIGPLIKGFFFR